MDYRKSVPKERVNRGGKYYYLPKGWMGIGLVVRDKFDEELGEHCNDWLDKFKVGWCVAFHGLKDPKTSLQSIINHGEIAPGSNNRFENRKDINKRSDNFGNACGIGVYFSPHIEVSEQYCATVNLKGKKYKIALQCRLKPEKIRIPKKKGDIERPDNPWDNDYWIVNDSEYIRAYRILLKEINEDA